MGKGSCGNWLLLLIKIHRTFGPSFSTKLSDQVKNSGHLPVSDETWESLHLHPFRHAEECDIWGCIMGHMPYVTIQWKWWLGDNKNIKCQNKTALFATSNNLYLSHHQIFLTYGPVTHIGVSSGLPRHDMSVKGRKWEMRL